MAVMKVKMTRQSFDTGRRQPITMVVLHSTAGKYAGDYNWLKQGGGLVKQKNGSVKDVKVSAHYYIDKKGVVTQMVDDDNVAYHAGVSAWPNSGRQVKSGTCNPQSIGIEIENRNNGKDPYPPVQYQATLQLVKQLVSTYNIRRVNLVRHLDIAPVRKNDPAGFPWERFVADVYAKPPAPAPVIIPPPAPVVVPPPAPVPVIVAPPTPAPVVVPEPLAPEKQLRLFLIDLAYRAAGSGVPRGWPLLREAVSRKTGMPVYVLSTAPLDTASADQDEPNRPLLLPGQPAFLVEAYARDVYYASVDDPSVVQTLSQAPAGALRDGLREALFRAADPANGFRNDWGFHQRWNAAPTELGVPIGPNHKVNGTAAGKSYACQHFALDTLYSPTDNFASILKLSDLTRDMQRGDPHTPQQKEVRALVLNDLYQARTGRAFDPEALFCKYAIANNLGAPTIAAEVQTLEGKKLVAMPYALDVLYCRIPDDGRWEGVSVGVLGSEDGRGVAQLTAMLTPEVLDEDAQPGTLGIEKTVDEVVPMQTVAGGILGEAVATPHITDLTFAGGASSTTRAEDAVRAVLVYPTPGPAAVELAAISLDGSAQTYHYYVQTDGQIWRLIEEERAAHAATGKQWHDQGDVDQWSIAVAVEAAADGMATDDAQAEALAWLLRDLRTRHGIGREHLGQAADLTQRVAALDLLLDAVTE